MHSCVAYDVAFAAVVHANLIHTSAGSEHAAYSGRHKTGKLRSIRLQPSAPLLERGGQWPLMRVEPPPHDFFRTSPNALVATGASPKLSFPHVLNHVLGDFRGMVSPGQFWRVTRIAGARK